MLGNGVNMTNKKILKLAIEKAVKNGWDEILPLGNLKILCTMEGGCEIHRDGELYATSNDIIFSHDFAKAFWGEEELNLIEPPFMDSILLAWEYHLMKMVLEKDPIKYLKKFI